MSEFNNKANNLFLISEDPSIHEKATIKDVAYEGAQEIKDLQQQLEQANKDKAELVEVLKDFLEHINRNGVLLFDVEVDKYRAITAKHKEG